MLQNKKRSVLRAISSELDIEIFAMMKKIEEVFGITPTITQATKIVAWKNRQYNISLTPKILKEILGGVP